MYKGMDPIVCCAEPEKPPDENGPIKDAVTGRKAENGEEKLLNALLNYNFRNCT